MKRITNKDSNLLYCKLKHKYTPMRVSLALPWPANTSPSLVPGWYLPRGTCQWSLNFEVWHLKAYYVLMCYGHSISSHWIYPQIPPSLVIARDATPSSEHIETTVVIAMSCKTNNSLLW